MAPWSHMRAWGNSQFYLLLHQHEPMAFLQDKHLNPLFCGLRISGDFCCCCCCFVTTGTQLTHNICRTFSEGSHKVRAVLTFWERFSQGICNLHVQHCSIQSIKQKGIYEIKDGLQELAVKGKCKVTKGQMFCEDF